MKKNIPLLAGLSLILSLAGCSSDDGKPATEISQEQLEAIAGTWMLTEYNVNPPQDVNNNGTPSENLLDEMDCLHGTLVLGTDFSWTLNTVNLSINPITGGAFGIVCTTDNSKSGDWLFLDNEVLLDKGSDGTLQLSGTTLTETSGNDLPQIRQLVYQKQ